MSGLLSRPVRGGTDCRNAQRRFRFGSGSTHAGTRPMPAYTEVLDNLLARWAMEGSHEVKICETTG